MRYAAVVILASTTLACAFGPTVREFRPARQPHGATIHFGTEAERYVGELLEARDAGLVVLTDGVLRLAPYDAIVSLRIEQVRMQWEPRRPPSAEHLDRLKLISRFPYGLEPGVLERLLRAHNQTELAGVGREALVEAPR